MGRSGNEDNTGRGGSEFAGVIIRGVGTFILGSALGLTSWVLYELNSISQEIARIQENARLQVLENSFKRFHENYYREQAKHEEVEKAQWAAIEKKK